MRCSLFGKLAAKRDFIALFAPRELLNVWEPWMQGCVSASRDSLADAWQEAYLTAPIWRFWLGADICGTTVTGAFMSSLDGVGRYYPLTLFAYADRGTAIAPPEIDGHEEWFAAAEDFLLATLEKDVAFEAVTAALDRLAVPASQPTRSQPDSLRIPTDGTIVRSLGGASFSELFASFRNENHFGVYAAASFWWTVGGGGCPPLALCSHGMPDASLFVNMLTGQIEPPPNKRTIFGTP